MWSTRKLAKDIGGALFGVVLLAATALIGIAWLTFALYSALAESQGVALAATFTGLIAIAPLVVLGLWTLRDPSRYRSESELPAAALMAVAPRIAATVESLARQRPVEAVVVCLLLGFTAARRPGQLVDLLLSLGGLAPDSSNEKPGD